MGKLGSSYASPQNPLANEELRQIDDWWHACNYLSVGMIYLRDNPLLKEPLKPEHVKHRLLGHWGASPALSFVWAHLNRVIKRDDLDVIFMAGPGHGAPGVLGPAYLEGRYSEIYPDKSEDEEGMQKFFKQFSFPGHIGSHVTPETPGSIHEGGELGYSLSHAYGAAFDNPDSSSHAWLATARPKPGRSPPPGIPTSSSIRSAMARCCRSSTSTATRSPIRPSSRASAMRSWRRCSWAMDTSPISSRARSRRRCTRRWPPRSMPSSTRSERIQRKARDSGKAERPRWPMIVLRTPKGWTGPKEVAGHKVEGSWRSHQVPFSDVRDNPANLQLLESWMRSYKAEELFDAERPVAARVEGTGARRTAAHERESACQWRAAAQGAEAAGLSRAMRWTWRRQAGCCTRTPGRWVSSCATPCATT